MNCGDPTMENRFQVAKFLFAARKASSLFVWSKMAQGSLGLPVLPSESVISGPYGVKGPF